MSVLRGGRPLRAAAAARLLVTLGVAGYLLAVGALVALGALAVLVVLEWADTAQGPTRAAKGRWATPIVAWPRAAPARYNGASAHRALRGKPPRTT
jgi:hypothetical protein